MGADLYRLYDCLGRVAQQLPIDGRDTRTVPPRLQRPHPSTACRSWMHFAPEQPNTVQRFEATGTVIHWSSTACAA